MWPYVASVGLGMAGSLAGNIFGKKNAGADDLATAIADAAGVQERMYGKTEAYLAPYRAIGEESLPYLRSAAFGGVESPLYKFRLKEGQRTLNDYLAARGLLGSGAGIRNEVDLVGRLTAEETDKNWGRLQYLSQLGYGAAGQTGQAATSTGQGIANTYMTGGTGLASLAAQEARDTSSLYSNMGYLGAGALSGYARNKDMMSILKMLGGGGYESWGGMT